MFRGSYSYAEAFWLGGLHDRAGRKGGTIAAAAALIPVKPLAIDELMLMAIAALTSETI